MKTKTKLFVAAMAALILFSEQSVQATEIEFHKCMNVEMGLGNTTWGMFLSKSIPEEFTSNMTVDQIASSNTIQKEIQKVVLDVAQQNIARFVRNSTTALMTKKEYNINTEFSHSLRLFTRHLRMRLNQVKNRNWTKPISMQLIFAPRVSETLLDRRTEGVVPRLSVYPKDRFLVMEQIPDSDSIPRTFLNEVENLTTAGINLLAHKATDCGSSGPYLVAATIQLNILPEISQSEVKAQLVVGMPMGGELPFEQANDQIRFTKVVMPATVSDAKSATGFAALAQYPMAFVNFSAKLSSSEMPLLVRFGSIGSLSTTGFERTNGEILRTQVPRLRGTPVGKIKDLLNVDFGIYNIAAMIDYTKYQTNEVLEIKELNLYISVGLEAMANYKVGMINKKEIDDQFKSEINKTIKATIEKQQQDLKSKAINIAAENTQLKPAEVEELMKVLFTVAKSELKK